MKLYIFVILAIAALAFAEHPDKEHEHSDEEREHPDEEHEHHDEEAEHSDEKQEDPKEEQETPEEEYLLEGFEPYYGYYEPQLELHAPEIKPPGETEIEWKAEYGRYPIDTVVPWVYRAPVHYRYAPLRYRYEYPTAYRYRMSYDPEYFHDKYGFYPEH